jgi:serine/threonine-protein kinase
MASLPPVQPHVVPGDVVSGKYVVECVLGAGGMGIVYGARHLELDQPVALKFILPTTFASSGLGSVERFLREAKAAVRLRSEHVARVYDVGRDEHGALYIVLERLEGMDLQKLIESGDVSVLDAVEYVLQACEALVEAHALGIVHRDLKPQNLFVTRRLNGAPLVKVLDFGIAKAIGPSARGQLSLTDSASMLGSPLYMAPEQMRSARSVDARSDIWALGVILYRLLGGQVPFDGETATEICVRVVNETPLSLLVLRAGLSPALVAIVMRCLEKDPDARFHNVAALAAALEPFARSAADAGLYRSFRSFETTQDSDGGALARAVLTSEPSRQVTEHRKPLGFLRRGAFSKGLLLGIGAALVGVVGLSQRATVVAVVPSAPPTSVRAPAPSDAEQALAVSVSARVDRGDVPPVREASPSSASAQLPAAVPSVRRPVSGASAIRLAVQGTKPLRTAAQESPPEEQAVALTRELGPDGLFLLLPPFASREDAELAIARIAAA